jgi:hypothetical protein
MMMTPMTPAATPMPIAADGERLEALFVGLAEGVWEIDGDGYWDKDEVGVLYARGLAIVVVSMVKFGDNLNAGCDRMVDDPVDLTSFVPFTEVCVLVGWFWILQLVSVLLNELLLRFISIAVRQRRRGQFREGNEGNEAPLVTNFLSQA